MRKSQRGPRRRYAAGPPPELFVRSAPGGLSTSEFDIHKREVPASPGRYLRNTSERDTEQRSKKRDISERETCERRETCGGAEASAPRRPGRPGPGPLKEERRKGGKEEAQGHTKRNLRETEGSRDKVSFEDGGRERQRRQGARGGEGGRVISSFALVTPGLEPAQPELLEEALERETSSGLLESRRSAEGFKSRSYWSYKPRLLWLFQSALAQRLPGGCCKPAAPQPSPPHGPATLQRQGGRECASRLLDTPLNESPPAGASGARRCAKQRPLRARLVPEGVRLPGLKVRRVFPAIGVSEPIPKPLTMRAHVQCSGAPRPSHRPRTGRAAPRLRRPSEPRERGAHFVKDLQIYPCADDGKKVGEPFQKKRIPEKDLRKHSGKDLPGKTYT